jgi:hypothetical protein
MKRIVALVFIASVIGCTDSQVVELTRRLQAADARSVTVQPSACPTPPPPGPATEFSGTGRTGLTKAFTLGAGPITFKGSHKGQGNFSVVLTGEGGQHEGLLFNVIGAYTGTYRKIVTPGVYYLDVQADGPWTVTIGG